MSDVFIKLSRDSKSVILDTFENDGIAVNKLFSDIETFESRGSFSQTFRIPLTPTNVEFFGQVANVNNNTFDLFTKIDAELCVGSMNIYNGYCQIKKIVRKQDGVDDELELIFFADTPSLIATIKEKKIADLSNLSDLNHEMTRDNVLSPPANTLWTLIERGQKFSEGEETSVGRPIFNTTSPLFVGDLTPAVNALYLWREIFSDAGFTYNSSFIDNTLNDYWIVFNNSQAVKTTESPESITFAVTNTSPYTFDQLAGTTINLNSASGFNELFDNGGNVAGGVFTAPYYANFTFRVLIKIKKTTIGGSSDSIGFRLVNPTNGETHIAVDGTSVYSTIVSEDNTYFTFQFTKTYLLNEGDEVGLRGIIPPFSGGEWTIDEASGFELVTTSTPLQGATVNLPANAPDYKQEDFIRDIIKLHYLVLIPDQNEPKKINVEPFSTYIGSGDTKDWTHKLHVGDKDVVVYSTAEVQNKNLKFTYTAGGEYLSQIFTEQGSRVYGQKEINNTSNDFATGDKRVELQLRSTPCNEIEGTNIPVPKFISETGTYVVPGPRMLYNAGSAVIALFNETTEEGELTEVSTLSHYSATLPTLTDYDLNFSAETALQVINANPFNNAYQLYYSRSFNEIYSTEARIMEAYFKLSLSDFRNIQFKDKIYIKDSYWRLLEIGSYFVGQEQLTFVKLAKLVGEIRDCEYIPVSITLGGKVNFEDGAGEPSDGSETCCTRYGYKWDSDRGECFSALLGGNERISIPSPAQVTSTLSKGFNNSIDGSSDNTFVNGSNNLIGTKSGNSSIFGNSNEISDLAGVTLVSGNGVKAVANGMHYGLNSSVIGRAQGGLMIAEGEGDYTASNDGIVILFNGEKLAIPNLSVWVCTMNVTAINPSGDMHSAIFAFRLSKDTTTAASSVTTLFQSGDFNTLSLNIDTITDTSVHGFKVNSSGASGYPFNDVRISATLQYTQVI
jgi:hypothetical protein